MLVTEQCVLSPLLQLWQLDAVSIRSLLMDYFPTLTVVSSLLQYLQPGCATWQGNRQVSNDSGRDVSLRHSECCFDTIVFVLLYKLLSYDHDSVLWRCEKEFFPWCVTHHLVLWMILMVRRDQDGKRRELHSCYFSNRGPLLPCLKKSAPTSIRWSV